MLKYIIIFLTFLLFKVEFSKTGLIVSGKEKWDYKMVPRKLSFGILFIAYGIYLFFTNILDPKYVIYMLQKEWSTCINDVKPDYIYVTVGEIPKKYDRYKYF